MADTNLPLDGAALPAENIESLRARVAELEQERDEDDALRTRMGDILTLTVNALKGEPDSRSLHDWATLPEVARETVAHANALRDALEDVLLNRDCACYEDGEPNCCDVCAARYADAAKSIATTPRASLAAYRADVLVAAESAIRSSCPKAHTYASENADIYIAQDHMIERAIAAIRALAAQEDK